MLVNLSDITNSAQLIESTQLSTNSSTNSSSSSTSPAVSETTTTSVSKATPKKLTTESSINFIELTTKTLSLTNQSSLISSLISESIKSRLNKANKTNSANSNVNVNVHQTNTNNIKNSKQRNNTSSNSSGNINNILVKQTDASSSRSQPKSTKIETPVLNNLFDLQHVYRNHHHHDR